MTKPRHLPAYGPIDIDALTVGEARSRASLLRREIKKIDRELRPIEHRAGVLRSRRAQTLAALVQAENWGILGTDPPIV